MNDLAYNLHSVASGHRFITRDEVLNLLPGGCVMCRKTFPVEPIFLYETTDLWTIGLSPIETARCQLAVLTPKGATAAEVVIVDKKAAVCLRCWITFLKQVVALKGKND